MNVSEQIEVDIYSQNHTETRSWLLAQAIITCLEVIPVCEEFASNSGL